MSMEDEAQRLLRQRRVEQKAREAIEYLAEVDLSAAASVLRVGRIEVRDDPTIPTAALQREHGFSQARFRIVLNAEFCDRSQRDLTAILLHELMHHVMRHLEGKRLGENPNLSNIVEDAFINRTINLLNSDLGGFFSDFYDPQEMPQLLLRSQSHPQEEADRQLYQALQAGHLTEQDLYQALEDRGQGDSQVQLIGSHDDQEDGNSPVLPAAGTEQILQQLGEQLGARGQQGRDEASRLEQLAEKFLRLRRGERVAPLQRAMQQAITQHLRSNLLQQVLDQSGVPQNRTPVMPERPVRSDLYWILAGFEPVLWKTSQDQNPRGAVAVYLDVSGSMNHYLGTVYECCLAFEDYLATDIYLFSNQVETVHIEDLKAGRVATTYGTDFDCAVEHFLERSDVDRAILFSDGYAALSPELHNQLQNSHQQMIGVLTPRGSDRVMQTFCSRIFEMPEA